MMPVFDRLFRLSGIVKVAVVLAIVAACSASAKNKLVVAVSYAPYAKVVDAIGGDEVEVVTLLPPGSDLRNYKPKPQEIKEFSRADVYFTDGSGVDRAWFSRFRQVKKSIAVVDISENIAWRNGADGRIDPYIWNSPKRVSTICANVRMALSELRPEKDRSFVVNLSLFLRRLNRVNDDLRKSVLRLPKENRKVLVTRSRFGYMAYDYDFQQIPLEVSGNGPKDIKKLVEAGRKHDVRLVIVSPQFGKQSAEALEKELGAKVVIVDAVSYNFLNEMTSVTNAFRDIR